MWNSVSRLKYSDRSGLGLCCCPCCSNCCLQVGTFCLRASQAGMSKRLCLYDLAGSVRSRGKARGTYKSEQARAREHCGGAMARRAHWCDRSELVRLVGRSRDVAPSCGGKNHTRFGLCMSARASARRRRDGKERDLTWSQLDSRQAGKPVCWAGRTMRVRRESFSEQTLEGAKE